MDREVRNRRMLELARQPMLTTTEVLPDVLVELLELEAAWAADAIAEFDDGYPGKGQSIAAYGALAEACRQIRADRETHATARDARLEAISKC